MSPRWLHWPAAVPSGPTLIIYDAFGGSGTVNGRTPDTVDNGNAWVADNYTVSSGYAYASASSGSSYMVIDTAASTFDIEAITQGDDTGGGTEFRHGIYFHFNSGTGAYARLILNDDAELVIQENNGSTFVTNTSLDTFSAIANSTDILLELSCSSGTVTYDLTVSGSSVTSGSLTPTYAPNFAGFWARYSVAGTHCSDFKVYA